LAAMLDSVIIGAGWAGLAVSAALVDRGIRHRLFERSRIGESWRSARWDSFLVNTPNMHTVMPGDRYVGNAPTGSMTAAALVALLEDYAHRRGLPVECGRDVAALTREADGFRCDVDGETVLARTAVLACGHQSVTLRPGLAAALPARIAQLDALTYRNPRDLPPGSVLVVGSGQSGGQIAEELNQSGRRVFLATSRVGRFPQSYRGRHALEWGVDLGLMDVPREDLVRNFGAVPTRALNGADHTISLQGLSASGVVLLGRLTAVQGQVLILADDLGENLAHGDRLAQDFRDAVDAHIAEHGLPAPPGTPDPGEAVAPVLADPPIRALDLADAGIGTVIWCTGVRGDYRFLQVPGVLDARGAPIEAAGVSPVTGLYVAGVPYSVSRRSGTILAAEPESAHIAGHLARTLARA
jgi:putative flavoprotein involved in K+ transport